MENKEEDNNKEDVKKEVKKRLQWRTQDWIWLLVFLLYAQVFSFIYKDLIMSVVSYVSTFVSIALAAVAIYISVREATKGDHVKDEINLILGEMREKLNQMDTKFDKFDLKDLNSEREIKIDQISEEITDKIKKEIEQNISHTTEVINKSEVIGIVTEQVEKATKDLKSSLTIREKDLIGNHIDHKYPLSQIRIKPRISANFYNEVKNIIYSLDKQTEITIHMVRGALLEKRYSRVDKYAISRALKFLHNKGHLIETDKGTYFRK